MTNLVELGSYINTMIYTLNQVLHGVREAAIELTQSTKEIANTSLSISHGANESAASLEEVSSTLEQMASHIEINSQNASHTEEISVLANNGMHEAAGQFGKLLKPTEKLPIGSA